MRILPDIPPYPQVTEKAQEVTKNLFIGLGIAAGVILLAVLVVVIVILVKRRK